jgi:hypothetical protein
MTSADPAFDDSSRIPSKRHVLPIVDGESGLLGVNLFLQDVTEATRIGLKSCKLRTRTSVHSGGTGNHERGAAEDLWGL